MDISFKIILLVVGFFLLIKGADYFVEGSSAIAKRLKVPSIVVGLTIVAIGTSLPEMAVSTVASINNSNAMALSNVVGSNIFNLLMVLGISSLFHRVNVKKSVIRRETPFLIGITALTFFLAGDALWFGNVLGKVNIFNFENNDLEVGAIGRLDGALLLVLFAWFIIWTVKYALSHRDGIEEENENVISVAKSLIFIVFGIIAIVIGGELVVDSAQFIALKMGMSETLVGLTIVALGTSLPELVTSTVAAKKGETDIAVGNVIGSNISNLLLVLGASSAISAVTVSVMSLIDLLVSLVFTIILFVMVKRNKGIGRKSGVILVSLYVLYMAYIIARQYL